MVMNARRVNVLFLCAGNSARSILAEVILNHKGRGRFKACSAGSHRTGNVIPSAIALLKRMQMPTAGRRSKAWDDFACRALIFCRDHAATIEYP